MANHYNEYKISLDLKDDRVFSILHQELRQILVCADLSTCCQNLEKNWSYQENLGEGGGHTLKGSDREKYQF